MTKRNASACKDCPATQTEGRNLPSARWRGADAAGATALALRAFLAACLLAPLAACAVPAPAESAPPAAQPAPVVQPTAPRAEPAPATSPAQGTASPAPAAQQAATPPRRAGETTTGRAPAPARPAPSATTAPAAPAPAPLPGDQPAAVAETPATQPAVAPPPSQQAPQVALPGASPTTGPAAGSLLQTILALALVLAVLAALAYFLKRYGPRITGSSAHLRLVGSLSLGARERIVVVEVGDQWIVVGASPGRINALATMPRQEGAQVGEATLAGHTQPAASFSDWLKNTIDKRNAK